MTIKDYYNNYSKNNKYPFNYGAGKCNSIDDFYNDIVEKNVLLKANVLAWHKMLIEYIDRDDAIFWIRRYENGEKKNGVWNTRRACLTQFPDGFKYVFVSNYDAHEILNMIRLGVNPDINEFSELMNNYEFPMHYAGKSCEESLINAYPNRIGSVYGGILTTNNLYLAHINGIWDDKYLYNGKYEKISSSLIEKIFPRGDVKDWNKVGNVSIRTMHDSLSAEEKALVKACFLRFVDPLNYYVTPGDKYSENNTDSRISNYDCMNRYMVDKYRTIFGKKEMDEFFKRALIKDSNNYSGLGKTIIELKYDSNGVNKAKKAKPKTTKSTSKSSYEYNGKSYSALRDLIHDVLSDYIKDNKTKKYSDLVSSFDMKFGFNHKPVIRKKSECSQSDLNGDKNGNNKRVFADVFKTTDDIEIVISNQVSGSDMDEFIDLAKKNGYIIKSI